MSRLRPAESAVSLPLTAQNRRRESQTSHSGDMTFQLNDSSVFFFYLYFSKKLLGLSVCPCYGKKAARMFWKLLNIVLKLRSCVRDAGADGSGWWILLQPATNKWTYGKHWRLSVGVSTVLEHTERAVRARGDCPTVIDCGWFHYLGWIKKVYEIIIVIKMCHQI